MEKNTKKRSGNGNKIALGVLPELLKEGKVYKAISEPPSSVHQQYFTQYRRMTYRIMDELLEPHGLVPRSTSLYKKWFTNPEHHVNGAFLERRNNPEKWTLVVNAMYFALSETLKQAITDGRDMIRGYEEKDRELSAYLNNLEKEVHHG